MRISDWSSDVGSFDLRLLPGSMWLVGRAFLVGSQNEPASRTFRKLREINPRAYGSRHSTRNPRPMSARDADFMFRPGRPRDGPSQGRPAKSFVTSEERGVRKESVRTGITRMSPEH